MLVGWNVRDGLIIRGVCDLLEKVVGLRIGFLVWSCRWVAVCKESRIEFKRVGGGKEFGLGWGRGCYCRV